MTVTAAAIALAAGILFVQIADGQAVRTVLTAAPQRELLVTPTLAATRPTCRHIVHLGDSNLVIAAPRFRTAYNALGVDAVIDTALGRGAQIAEDGTTALAAIAHNKSAVAAFGRCWVVELSAADAVRAARDHTDPTISIRAMANAIGTEPVLWVTPVLASTTTEWTLAASSAYNVALVEEASLRPNVTVFDWQDIALQHLDQFEGDGVHYQPPLYDTFVRSVMGEMSTVWSIEP